MDGPTSARGSGSGSRASRHPMLTPPWPCVSLHALQVCAPEPPRRLGAPPTPLLRPGALCRGAAEGGGGSHCSLRPCALLQPVGTPVYSPGAGNSPLPGTQASPSSPGIPFPPCGCGNIPDSRAPGREGGSADPVAEVEGYRSGCGGNKGTLVLFQLGKASLVHDLTTQSPPKTPTYSESSSLFPLEKKIAPSQAPRSLPSPVPLGPSIPGLQSASLRLPRCPTLPPSLFTHPGQRPPDSNSFSSASEDGSGLAPRPL